MLRRIFLKALIGLAGLPVATRLQAKEIRPIPVQRSPVAGLQYHRGEEVWPQLQAGMPLELKREPENRYDRKAVAVYWQGAQLGYVPRAENHAVGAMLDRGQPVKARISALSPGANPWRRIQMEIYIES
ncbi:HIRAN domain-containing protein [Sedimenticola hydrogenitrophicus]|uniref:HIRAN domain-containing protein n=1 Tax=Sedimenticola hydrogenitrophicus TaxID=2967975 RepID=UPI0023AF138F|nr:HIRAN domain-containing protein [Sedimenticola hydrogenitrophicus]